MLRFNLKLGYSQQKHIIYKLVKSAYTILKLDHDDQF